MINESGTMSGGGGKPRGGRMCLGTAAPKTLDTRAAAAELQAAEEELGTSTEASIAKLHFFNMSVGSLLVCCLKAMCI